MPRAAGDGRIAAVTPQDAAAGQGEVYTAQQAADAIRDDTPRDEFAAILRRVKPLPEWYRTRDIQQMLDLELGAVPVTEIRPALRQWLRDGRISPLRVGGRKTRKTRAKRKHFRKRTSRRT